MAPQSRKRKSDAVEDTPQPTTPTGSPAHKKLKVTASQKQILIDNLQLEITERARKLRAQYAVQAADLRSRIERRVNRIPTAVRKMTMGELMKQHAKPQSATAKTTQQALAAARDRPLPPLPQDQSSKAASPARQRPSPAKGKKRKSSLIHIARDNEDDVFVSDTLPVSKKTRTKAAAGPPRATSRTGKPTNVLSPRSHNSRTLRQSPIKSFSPVKSTFSRPLSPLKPASPFKAAASAATSAISASMHGMYESTKRGTAAAAGKLSRTASREKSPQKPTIASTTNIRGDMAPPPRPGTAASPQRSVSQTSAHTTTSESSTGTTVVKPMRGTRAAATKAAPAAKPRATRAAATGATKQTAASAAKGKATGAATKTTARTAAAKKAVAAEPAPTGRRVLRKRAD
jgi:hypothetical protein